MTDPANLTTPHNLDELADRVEAATAEQQREIMYGVYEALAFKRWLTYDQATNFMRLVDADACLDAAMTLLPDAKDSPGEYWNVEQWVKQSAHPPHVMATAWVYGTPRTYAATPALALTAACLRARASLTRGEVEGTSSLEGQ